MLIVDSATDMDGEQGRESSPDQKLSQTANPNTIALGRHWSNSWLLPISGKENHFSTWTPPPELKYLKNDIFDYWLRPY